MKKIKIVEIFYSIQGEGANFGMPAVFVRFAGCNKNCNFCDTDWSMGNEITIAELKEKVREYNCKNIIWTGGEPTLQLTNEILVEFSDFYNCIETNGTNIVPSGIDYITCSPKVGMEELRNNIKFANEFRYPISAGDSLPKIKDLPKADRYLISPIFDGSELDEANLEYCILLVKNNHPWRLSMQFHKLLNVR